MYKQLVVFTDLDGTLLDHHTYSFQPAEAMLARLNSLNIAVIPNTSKTAAELAVIRQETKLDTPFVVENGAAIYIPKGFLPEQPQDTEEVEGYWRKAFVPDRSHWLELLENKAGDYKNAFRGFSDMDDNDLSLATGLSLESANLANNRQFSEPLQWLGTEKEKDDFTKLMKGAGANVLQGGRFVHISGKCNKGVAMRWLTKELEKQNAGTRYKSVALGDSFNDNDMLEAADIAVQIKSPKHDYPKLFRTDALWQSTMLGPKGWHECLEQILSEELTGE